MKNKLSIGLMSLSLVLFGCQTNEMDEVPMKNHFVQLSPQELLSIKYKSTPELSQSEMFNLLESFQAKDLNEGPGTKGSTTFEIRNKYYLNKDDISRSNIKTKSGENIGEQIPVYEIDFSSNGNKGIAVVSGDLRAPHILAYIDKIKEDNMNLSTGPNVLLQWAEMYIRNEVNAFDKIKDSLYVSAISKVSKELNLESQDIKYEDIKGEIVVENKLTRSTPIEEVPSNLRVITATYPLCPSAWGQWEPYNCQLPIGDCEKYFPDYVESSNYPTGWGALTIAHLMTCIEPAITASGVKMNWIYLTENKEITAPDYFNPGDPLDKRNMVGYLIKEIYAKTKSYPVKNSKGVITGSTCSVPDMENYLRTIFACGGTNAWNITTIKNSLKAARPVCVWGRPDNKVSDGVYPFILDGLKECYGRIDNVPKDINVNYIHANFGFGGGWQDGYYLMDIEKTTITFETTVPLIFKDNALTMIPDIRKK